MKEKSLFERLDDISSTQEDILDAINGVNDNLSDSERRISRLEQEIKQIKAQPIQQRQVAINKQIQPNEPPLKTFARQARKSWRWLGDKKEFAKAKNVAILLSVIALVFGLISSIVTTISCGMYSPFTGLENVWIVFLIIYIVFASKSRLKYDANLFGSATTFRCQRDEVGLVVPIGGEKVVFRVFRWITLISIVFNIVWIWMHQSDYSIAATIVEILFAVFIVISFFANVNLYAQYCIIWLDGRNLTTGEPVSLIRMPHAKNFITEKDAREKIPFLFR